MTKYGRSPWVDQFPKSRVPSYPRPRTPIDIDVAIIGGGVTGCVTAYAFAAAGIKVALFEAERIGRGASGASVGWISPEPRPPFGDAEKALGRRAARHVWQSWRRAALDFSTLIRRLDIKCYLEPSTALQIAAMPEQALALKREQKARKEAGLDASAVNARAVGDETGLTAAAGLRSREAATLDPYRLTLGLAAAAAERGAQIFEQTPVTRITFTRKSAAIFTSAGPTRVSRIVVATGFPTELFRSLLRHFWFHTAYLALTEPVPGKIRSALGTRCAVVRDWATPPHTVRWAGGGEQLLVAGADGGEMPARSLEKTIVQRTGQLMYELSTMYPDISGIQPAYGWAAPYARTANGVPSFGPHRNFPFHLFAFGDSSSSVTGSYLASRIFLRQHLGEADAADEAFGFRL
jgi:glycine/D-amino acid oxidase-like deaminating enzyme